jgi:sulfide:quinone oxidoreductase
MHSYQPGWTLVGGGVFSAAITRRPMADVILVRASWYALDAERVEPQAGEVVLGDGCHLGYSRLVVAPGLVIDWGAIEGLEQTLGQYGVTSNYRFDLAPYIWSLVQSLEKGRALFTQPPMPIKCAGAPQKAMYLSCDHWRRQGRLAEIEVSFCNAGQVLFGVADYVPALEGYIERYGIEKTFGHRLVAVDGPSRTARVVVSGEDGERTVERGRIVLAEFGYGGALQPTFPRWVNEGTRATRRAWWLKAKQLPWLYWNGMLKGHEWLARPARLD